MTIPSIMMRRLGEREIERLEVVAKGLEEKVGNLGVQEIEKLGNPVNDLEIKTEEIRDTIVVHGMVLHGKITKIGPERLSFQLLYSKGQSHFAYRDIDSIKTKYTYHISYHRMDIEGRVVGIEDKKYLKVVEKDDNLRTVKIADIDNFVMSVNDDASFENRVRNRFPYTKGNINVGFQLENGSTIKNSIDALLNVKYKQAQHEVMLYVDYEYETRETETTPKYDYTDELVGILTYRNHFKNNQFWYTMLAADYDRPRHIKNRFIPSAGYGYRFEFDKSIWLEPFMGLGYATTRYTDDILYENKDFGYLNSQEFLDKFAPKMPY